jgi:hypothetical protein
MWERCAASPDDSGGGCGPAQDRRHDQLLPLQQAQQEEPAVCGEEDQLTLGGRVEGETEHAAILPQPDVVRLLAGLVRYLAYGNKGLWSVFVAVYSGYFVQSELQCCDFPTRIAQLDQHLFGRSGSISIST